MNHCLLENFSRIIRIKVTWSCLIYFQLCFFLKLLQNLSSILKKIIDKVLNVKQVFFFRIHLYRQSERTNPIIYLRWPVTNRIQSKINDRHITSTQSIIKVKPPSIRFFMTGAQKVNKTRHSDQSQSLNYFRRSFIF